MDVLNHILQKATQVEGDSQLQNQIAASSSHLADFDSLLFDEAVEIVRMGEGGGAQPYSIAFWGVSCNNVEYITTYIDLIRLAFSDFVCCVQMITRMGTAIGQGGKEQSERKGD